MLRRVGSLGGQYRPAGHDATDRRAGYLVQEVSSVQRFGDDHAHTSDDLPTFQILKVSSYQQASRASPPAILIGIGHLRTTRVAILADSKNRLAIRLARVLEEGSARVCAA